jgi:hypothetical protein
VVGLGEVDGTVWWRRRFQRGSEWVILEACSPVSVWLRPDSAVRKTENFAEEPDVAPDARWLG